MRGRKGRPGLYTQASGDLQVANIVKRKRQLERRSREKRITLRIVPARCVSWGLQRPSSLYRINAVKKKLLSACMTAIRVNAVRRLTGRDCSAPYRFTSPSVIRHWCLSHFATSQRRCTGRVILHARPQPTVGRQWTSQHSRERGGERGRNWKTETSGTDRNGWRG